MTREEKKRISMIHKVLPCVVAISTSAPSTSSNISTKKDLLSSSTKKTKKDSQPGGGSGFLVHSSGLIVTNIHVIEQSSETYFITLHDGTQYTAHLVGTDTINDIAYLQIISEHIFPTLSFADSSRVAIGQSVYAVGDALGFFRNTISAGIVSGLARSINAHNEVRSENLRGLIQTDAAINPGNSGGPLIDSDGKVIGVNAAHVSLAENIGFAIPINVIKNDVQDIITYGKIRRGFLGVRHIIITPHIQSALSLPVSEGILIISPSPKQPSVIPGSPAAQAGILDKDIILAINQERLTQTNTLEDVLQSAQGGQEITITLLRKSKELSLTATLTEGV